ncbi:MAG: stage III sporulation protein AB [Eubacteriales bacterium]
MISLLPMDLRGIAEEGMTRFIVEEIRLRLGQPISFVTECDEVVSESREIASEDLQIVLGMASEHSVHSVQEQICRGFLTVEGGHRVGLCGTVVLEHGEMVGLRTLSSVSIRVARQVVGVAREIVPQLYGEHGLENTLILSPPGFGKTTLLRDLVRAISDGEGVPPLRVGVADERGEITALRNGRPQFDVGRLTDVVEGCSKEVGMMLLLRSMNPQVLAVDEITQAEDIDGMEGSIGCGVKLLATAHGASKRDLFSRPLYRRLYEGKLFSKLVTLERRDGKRVVVVEDFL